MSLSKTLTDLGFSLRTGQQLMQSLMERDRQPLLETHVPELDRLQGGGLRRGTLVDIMGPRSSGRLAMAMATIAAATRAGEATAFIDPGRHLDAPGARAAGVDLTRLLWVSPRDEKSTLLSTEMALDAGFALVVLDLAALNLPIDPPPESVWNRFARATAEHRAILLVVRASGTRRLAADVQVETAGTRVQWEPGHPALLRGSEVQVSVRQRKGAWSERKGALHFMTREEAGL